MRVVARTHESRRRSSSASSFKDLRVNGRREILPTYCVVTDAGCALPSSMGHTGFEPRTSSLSGKFWGAWTFGALYLARD